MGQYTKVIIFNLKGVVVAVNMFSTKSYQWDYVYKSTKSLLKLKHKTLGKVLYYKTEAG